MKGNLAAQVMSHTVTAIFSAVVATGKKTNALYAMNYVLL
jgi:hypothetical protein